MQLEKVAPGKNVPWDLNVVIEIPQGADPIKYEIDKDSGMLVVDRFLHTAMYYPCNYGFIPNTLSDDGDPVDALVVGPQKIIPGAVIRVRPIGVLIMEDEKGQDEKILAVPHDELHPFYTDTVSWRNLPQVLIDQISHFFEHYKDLEEGKWVKVKRWGEAEEAAQMVEEGIQRHLDTKKD